MSLPSRRRHWMNIRLRTKLRAGGSRPHYQQFDYATSDIDDEPSGAMLPIRGGPCSPLIIRTWTNSHCLQTHLLSLFHQIPCPTSFLMTAYFSCFLTTSSRAHRHHNCRPQTTHNSNFGWYICPNADSSIAH